MEIPFYTIGHSTRSLAELAELLAAAGVSLLVDVRSVPFSRANPQYNQDALPQRLAAFGVAYAYIPALGGLRKRNPAVSPLVNAYWSNESFRHYADYAMSEAFRKGLAELQGMGHRQPCAIMCAEAVWWRCHRRIITDYLLAAGEKVYHILGRTNIKAAAMTPEAQIGPDGVIAYPGE